MYDVCTLCMMYVCMYLLDWARISRYIHHPYKSGVGAQSTNQHRLLCMAGCTTTNQTLRLLRAVCGRQADSVVSSAPSSSLDGAVAVEVLAVSGTGWQC